MIKQNEIKMKLKSSSWLMYKEEIGIIQIQRPSRACALGPIFIIIFLNASTQIATLRWADVGLRAFGSLARRRNPTLAHRNVAHWRHVGPTFGLQPYANPIPPLSNVGPTSVKTIYNHVPT